MCTKECLVQKFISLESLSNILIYQLQPMCFGGKEPTPGDFFSKESFTFWRKKKKYFFFFYSCGFSREWLEPFTGFCWGGPTGTWTEKDVIRKRCEGKSFNASCAFALETSFDFYGTAFWVSPVYGHTSISNTKTILPKYVCNGVGHRPRDNSKLGARQGSRVDTQ